MEERKFNSIPIIVILILLIICLSGYIVYDKFIFINDEQIENNNNLNNDFDNGNDEEIVTDLSLSSSLVKDLSSKVIGIYHDVSAYPYYFFKRDKVILSDEPMSFKLSLAAEFVQESLKYVDRDCSKDIGGISYLDEEILKNAYYEIFGSDVVYERSSFQLVRVCGFSEYNWSNTNNRYEAKGKCGCGGDSIGGSRTKLAYAKQVKNNEETRIELYEYFVYADYDFENSTFKYYSDYNQTNFIGLDLPDDFFDKYSEQAGLYKYTFIQDNSGIYVFTSVEKVR